MSPGLVVDRLLAAAPPCAFRALTGLPCLSCGTTRALERLAHGDVPGALALQPLATMLALAALPVAAGVAAAARVGWRLPEGCGPEARRWLRAGTVYFSLVNWLYLVAAGV